MGICDDITAIICFFKFREEKINKNSNKEGAKGKIKKKN